MKNRKLLVTTISTVTIALSFIVFYKFFDKDNSYISANDEIVASYEGGAVTFAQARTELSKVIINNPNLKGLTFNDLNADQKEMVIKEVVIDTNNKIITIHSILELIISTIHLKVSMVI